MKVGIRELKAHLSQYVRMAAAGENVIVTARGKPVARLVSLGGTSMVERGIEEGWITPASRVALTPAIQYKASLSIMEVMDEDRG